MKHKQPNRSKYLYVKHIALWAACSMLQINVVKAGTYSIETLIGIISGPIQELGEPVVASPDCLGARFRPLFNLSAAAGESQNYSITSLIEYDGILGVSHSYVTVTIRGHYELSGVNSNVNFDGTVEVDDSTFNFVVTDQLDESNLAFPILNDSESSASGDFVIDQDIVLLNVSVWEDFDIQLSIQLSADAAIDGAASITLTEIVIRPIIFVGASNPVPGDINLDRRLDLEDINQMTDYLLGNEQLPLYWEFLIDLNSDGRLNGLDIQVLTDLLTNDCSE